jgi:sialidase-1
MEGIVRQIYDYNINTDIIFIYTITKEMANIYILGNEPNTVTVHEKLAKHYSIPSINVGKVLCEQINSGIGGWDEYTPDGVHPSDKGYIIYANEILKFITSALSKPIGDYVRTLALPLSNKPAKYAQLDDAWKSYQQGCEKEEITMYGRKYELLVSNTPETKLVYKFRGTGIGLYWIIASDSGNVEWVLDDGASNKASSWDKHALNFDRVNYCILDSNLEMGDHRLEITISNEKAPESKGTYIRIIGFLVEDEA